jgi:hypothetical protein
MQTHAQPIPLNLSIITGKKKGYVIEPLVLRREPGNESPSFA